MKEIKWGIVGCGDVTEVKSGPAFNKIPGSSLVAVMRRDGAKAADYARRHNVPAWYDDADKLINDPNVNAVYVATPPESHEIYTIKAAQTGKPVYVEKPMARTYQECQRMIEACSKAGVPLFVAFYRRRMPPFVKVREIVNSGVLGKSLFVNIQLYHPTSESDQNRNNLPWRVIPQIAGGGYFVDLASHQLDLLDYIFGPIIKVKGVAKNLAGLYPAEDTVSASFEFKSGVVGSGVWNFVASTNAKIDWTEIVGTKGKLGYSTFERLPIKLETEKMTEDFIVPWPEHVQQPLIQTIVDELRGNGRCPSIGVTGARSSRVIDGILEDYRTEKKFK